MSHKTPPITIRPATAQDAPAIAGLSSQLGYPATPDQITRRLEKIGQDHDHMVFVAESGGRVSGWVEVDVDTLLVDEGFAEIRGLVVDESVRGQGLGKALLEQVESWAREHGCAHIKVRSNVIRESAHHFYENLGYQDFKLQKNFRKVL